MKKYALLYVDDEESNLRIFRDTFRRDYEIYTASSAKEGMRILDEVKIDLVLSDQRMPEMSGVEFLKYSLKKYPEPNRILITAYSDLDAIQNAINQAHIFQYIQKPWSKEKLHKVIENALHIYQLEEENKKQKQELLKSKELLEQKNRELTLAKEKAEESDRLKTEFLQNLSHEIRTPMNAILGFSEFLDEASGEERKRYVSIIRNSGKQLLRIIDDILEISRLETRQVQINETEVCLNELLPDHYVYFDLEAKKKDLQLYLKKGLSDEESTVITDKSKLNKIISNLLENALKYTNEGYVEFGYRLNNGKIELYVKDSGKGIKKENQELIFKRFSQEEKSLSKKVGGLGLGLSIVKGNVDLLGGEITVKSEKGKGSVFTVTMPYKPVFTATGSRVGTGKDNEIKEAPVYKILIAEDEGFNFLLLETILKNNPNNFTVYHAEDGEKTIELCKEHKDISLVFMDLKLPEMDGFKATKVIKNLLPHVPVIALTAYSTPDKKELALSAGCDDFISKPINSKIINKVLDKWLSFQYH